MTTNKYINFQTASNEQKLIRDLTTEFIQYAGIDFYYLPRSLQKEDGIFHEDVLSSFNKYYVIEMYIENVDGFEGEGNLLSKFGFEVRDEITFVVSVDRFQEETGMVRPLEGDLVYMPNVSSLLEIKFVEDEEPFYPLGTLPAFKLKCELFRYSQEDFTTGVTEIDDINTILDPTGVNDTFADNTDIQNEADQVIDFNEQNPFGNY